jgi:putative alpha-1,2-mannosidase
MLNRTYYPGAQFVVERSPKGTTSGQVRSVKFNGKTLSRYRIDHRDIVNGGKLVFISSD